jgi:hypothetical protein
VTEYLPDTTATKKEQKKTKTKPQTPAELIFQGPDTSSAKSSSGFYMRFACRPSSVLQVHRPVSCGVCVC